MAQNLGAGNRRDRPGGGSNDFGVGGRDPNGPRSGPPQAENVRIRMIDVDTFLVSFTDLPPSLASADVQAYWGITYASKDAVGSQGGVLNWSQHVLNLSRRIATVQSSFSGQQISASFFLPGATDGYIQITGYYDNGAVGRPTLPILLNLSGGLDQTPDNVLSASVTISKERTPYDVLRIDATYTPPADVTKDYAGCHIHMANYNIAADVQELGAMDQWDHGTGTQSATYRLPIETGQGSGTATVSNGSGAVVRVSGTVFAAGWVGRKFIIDTSATSSTVYQISARADNDHLTITPVFSGTGGTYAFKTLNNVTFYFVSIGTSGARRPDYTAALSATI